MSSEWQSQFEYLKSVNPKDIYILGQNKFTILAAQYLNFEGFINDETSDTHFLGKKIFKLSQLNSKCFVINGSTMRPREARNKIRSKTEHQIHVFTFLENYSLAKNTDAYWNDFRQDYANNTSDYIEFEKSLNDHQSKLTWNHLKNIRLFGDFLNIDVFPKSYGKHYFPEFLEFKEKGEVFYDIGCFDGETTLDFIDECPTFKKIFAFEPNPNNLETLLTKFEKFKNIEVIRKGVSDSNEISGFSSIHGSASHFDLNSRLKVELVAIDSLSIEAPTFIKMDIEGMERFALEGARNIIERNRPKLAISVYHLHDDVRVIFRIISEMLPNSRFFLRHYSEGIHETVLFCLPN